VLQQECQSEKNADVPNIFFLLEKRLKVTVFNISAERCSRHRHDGDTSVGPQCGLRLRAGESRTNFSEQDKTWAEFSALEVAALQLLCSETKLPNLKFKTRPKQLLGYLPLDIGLPFYFLGN
jgi:hypothetical protein